MRRSAAPLSYRVILVGMIGGAHFISVDHSVFTAFRLLPHHKTQPGEKGIAETGIWRTPERIPLPVVPSVTKGIETPE